ncbi:MAG: CPBP family intramembrane metalloprotease [Acidobacteria bacterium]|nr:CPBP family intramembrane metalloprotease [Acidobacteriota bacterium]MBS1866239.1 CPBP family intramembrane metalloprotease [Acidobacteriota bacterium]
MPATRQIGPMPMLGLWGVLCMALAIAASLSGLGYEYGGRAFVATLAAFGLLLGCALLFGARGVVERAAAVGSGSGWLLGVALFLTYLLYASGTGTLSFARIGAVALFLFLPLAVLSTAESAPAGSTQDFLVIAGVWAAVKFGPAHWIWPFPSGKLAYILTMLLAVNLAIAGFLLLRNMKGTGYSIGWGREWTFSILVSLLAFACVAIPVGIRLRFIAFDLHHQAWNTLPLKAIGILLFVAWPEELLFRGLLQNCLSKATKSDLFGWIAASVLFGFSHITNGGFPNWKYVLLASIAGFFYGWTWRRTNSIFASALVHGAVDILWHFLFRTL